MQIEKIEPTKWNQIEIHFAHIIAEIREGVQGQTSEKSRDITIRKKTISFLNGTKMHCTEFIKNDYIDFYFYDLIGPNNLPIIKFHSERHEDKTYQTTTEPFHIHARAGYDDLKLEKRLPNPKYKKLDDILTFIEYSEYHVPISKK